MPGAVLHRCAREFSVELVDCLQQNAVADVWTARRKDASLAVLKYYHRGMGNEAAGFDYVSQFHGQHTAQIYAVHERTVLMEFLSGDALGDMARRGADTAAAQELATLARFLWTNAKPTPGLQPLDQVFAPMITSAPPAGIGGAQLELYRLGVTQAQKLLAVQGRRVPLHGDLHHDNIRQTSRGFCVFDAKGMLGDAGYELANAFRHPRGRPEYSTCVQRCLRVAGIWAEALDVTPRHLLSWAIAKTTLSIFWQAWRGPVAPVEFQHLNCFRQACAEV